MSDDERDKTTKVPEPKVRRRWVAEEKARLRADITRMVNKVPDYVNNGSIQTTRAWLDANNLAVVIAAGGHLRMSRKKLAALINFLRVGHIQATPLGYMGTLSDVLTRRDP